MSSVHLAFSGIRKSFGEHAVLQGVDLTVERGHVHFVLGPSGAGKSVLIKHVVGLHLPEAGRIILNGEDITGAKGTVLQSVRARCQLVLQSPTLFDQFDVLDNVALPLRGVVSNRRVARRRAHEALERVGAVKWAQRAPHTLGIGAQKRVTLARALALAPELLMYDEPTTGLDPEAARATDDLIASTTREMGITALVVSHDLLSVQRIAERVSFLHEGRIAFTDTPTAFFASTQPEVRAFTRPLASPLPPD